ncbi:MAG: hypothetical protein C0596_16035 [Marinilabiliales bacterium]|nr:MAG: hypothetical protein C0596_16035 [Marinilabiliales bacterium]
MFALKLPPGDTVKYTSPEQRLLFGNTVVISSIPSANSTKKSSSAVHPFSFVTVTKYVSVTSTLIDCELALVFHW